MDVELRKHFDVQTEVLGPEKECVKQLTIFNGVVTWELSGITWEPDPRHAEIVIDQPGLKDAKPFKLPGVKDRSRRDRKAMDDLEAEVAAVQPEMMAKEIHSFEESRNDDVSHIFSVEDAESRDNELREDGWVESRPKI